MNKSNKILTYLINLSFFLYFFILIIERLISVTLSLVNCVELYGNGFNAYVYSIIFASIIGWLIYVLINCKSNIKALITPNDNISFDKLCIASGILLLSGMVHSEFTIPVVQFISYGVLIVGIMLKVIENSKQSKNKTLLWLSFSYLVLFSMAIPVMYQSNIDLYIIFHILEGTSSFILVIVFTYLLLTIFSFKDDLFELWTIITVILLDVPLILLRWNEEINYFVLIFLILSIVIFIVGYIYKKIKIKRSK